MTAANRYINRRFGHLVVTGVADSRRVICDCDCGKTGHVIVKYLLTRTKSPTRSCGKGCRAKLQDAGGVLKRDESGDFYEIPLTNGKFAKVDAADYWLVRDRKWYAHNATSSKRGSNGKWYAVRVDKSGGKPVMLLMHRVIMGATSSSIYVDHGGDTLDNRRRNLTLVTPKENGRRPSLRCDTTSGYKGVHFLKDTGRWRASIRVDGVAHYLGSFREPKDAARRYDEAARIHFGPRAILNFPRSGDVRAVDQ